MKENVTPGSFRIVSNGHYYQIERFVRVWWLLWLGYRWGTLYSAGPDGYEYHSTGSHSNVQFRSIGEAQERIRKIVADEENYRTPFKQVQL